MFSAQRCLALVLILGMPLAHAENKEQKALRCQFSLRTLLLGSLAIGAAGTVAQKISEYRYLRSEEYMEEVQKRFNESVADKGYAYFDVHDLPLLEYDPKILEAWIVAESKKKDRLVPNWDVTRREKIRSLGDILDSSEPLPIFGDDVREKMKKADKALAPFLAAGNYKKIHFYDARDLQGSGNLLINDDPNTLVVLYSREPVFDFRSQFKIPPKDLKLPEEPDEKHPRIASRGPVVLLLNDYNRETVVSSEFIYTNHLGLPHAAPKMIYTEDEREHILSDPIPRTALKTRYKYGLHQSGLERAIQDGEAGVRFRAIEELARNDRNAPIIEKGLKDDSDEVRSLALEKLTEIEVKQIKKSGKTNSARLNKIMELLLNDESELSAADALQEIGRTLIKEKKDYATLRDPLISLAMTMPQSSGRPETISKLLGPWQAELIETQSKVDDEIINLLLKQVREGGGNVAGTARVILRELVDTAGEHEVKSPKLEEAKAQLKKKTN